MKRKTKTGEAKMKLDDRKHLPSTERMIRLGFGWMKYCLCLFFIKCPYRCCWVPGPLRRTKYLHSFYHRTHPCLISILDFILSFFFFFCFFSSFPLCLSFSLSLFFFLTKQYFDILLPFIKSSFSGNGAQYILIFLKNCFHSPSPLALKLCICNW